MKLASGIAPVTKMLDRGINVALGTDGMASNNNSDLFEEIKTAALLAKVSTQDPTALSAPQVLRMATVNGALCQGREEECGQIRVGMDADLIMLDFTQPHLIPCHNVLSHLAYSASGHDVCMTMVRGKILYAAGKYPTIDMNAVIKELSSYAMPKVFRDDD
jgi:5-methylthioadenosine/S-adenosylhomocysteine deaminase